MKYFNESPTLTHIRTSMNMDSCPCCGAEKQPDYSNEPRAKVRVDVLSGDFGYTPRELSRIATDLLVAELNRRKGHES